MGSTNQQDLRKMSIVRAPPPAAVHSEVLPPLPTPAIGNVVPPQINRHPPPLRLIDEFPHMLAQPSGRMADPSTPPDAPAAAVHPIYHYGLTRSHKPTQWAFDDDCDISAINLPGHAAYYESQTFRDMKARGETQTPGRGSGPVDDGEPYAKGEYVMRANKIEQNQSLVLVFSKTNVRRADGVRKVDARKQKRNQRA